MTNMLRFITPFVLSVLLCGCFTMAKAQSAVSACRETGIFAVCYGESDVNECSKNRSLDRGALKPSVIMYMSGKGYGCLAVGRDKDGKPVFGVCAGETNREIANQRAMQICKDNGGTYPYIAESWTDF